MILLWDKSGLKSIFIMFILAWWDKCHLAFPWCKDLLYNILYQGIFGSNDCWPLIAGVIKPKKYNGKIKPKKYNGVIKPKKNNQMKYNSSPPSLPPSLRPKKHFGYMWINSAHSQTYIPCWCNFHFTQWKRDKIVSKQPHTFNFLFQPIPF